MIRVKVCGLTTPEAVRAAVDAGVDAVGFVLARSPRQVDLETAARLCEEVPPFVTRVAVARWPAPALGALPVEVVQLYPPLGAPAPELGGRRYLPAFCDAPDLLERVAEAPPGPVLLDGGVAGSGEAGDWARIAAVTRRVVLAGGLGPDNVAAAIRAVRPAAVDVSSGVESAPGVKDPGRIRAFVQAVRGAE